MDRTPRFICDPTQSDRTKAWRVTTFSPKIGKIKVADLKRRDVEELHQSLKDSPYQANRVRALLSKMLNLAKHWEWRPDNPCEGVPKYREEKRDRWLSTEEIEHLCDALDKHPNQSAANAIRLMLSDRSPKGRSADGNLGGI